MKKACFLILVFTLIGCGVGREKLQTYSENPRYFIKDPHFENYKNNRDKLESRYLSGEISYADYVEEKGRLDNKYDREIQKRTSIITTQE